MRCFYLCSVVKYYIFKVLMKKIFHKILAILLIPMVLFSTTSFSVEKHICGENICSVSLDSMNTNNFHQEDDSCCIDDEDSCCTDEPDCCFDEFEFVKGSVVKKEKEAELKLDKVNFLTSFIITYQELFNSNISSSKHYINYTSPVIVKDILVNHQIFLI